MGDEISMRVTRKRQILKTDKDTSYSGTKTDGTRGVKLARKSRSCKTERLEDDNETSSGRNGIPTADEDKSDKRTSKSKISGRNAKVSKDKQRNIDICDGSACNVDSGINGSSSHKFVGAHCSIAGGVSNAVTEAVSIGARAFALFLRNGRSWKLTPLPETEATKFKELCKEHNFPPHLILPHGSYLLNCGSSNSDTLRKSRETLIHELQRCEMLGLTLYNFHPGSACGDTTTEKCIETIAESINLAHAETKFVKTVIENMSCQGSTVGGKIEELKSIIDKVNDKTRVGVCLDTCHAFAAGFDLATSEGFSNLLDEFDKMIGLKFLSGMHLNDSKGELGCHLDRHENIGKGHIGLEGFSCVMKDSRLDNIPMILETPPNDYAKEIKLLYSLE